MNTTQQTKAIDLIEDLIKAVETLQGLCGNEPPEDADHAEWVRCEMVANAAKFFIDETTKAAKQKTIVQCLHCKGTDVHVAVWIDANTGEQYDDMDYTPWCCDCGDHGPVDYIVTTEQETS